jgi:D-inositol-3-phosphate glycosyltransferase
MKVTMVSEHASPLAVLGDVDAGGQNVHVATLAAALASRGVSVTVHTRRDDAELPEWVDMHPGVRVHHVDAGPPRPVPKDELLPYMGPFAEELAALWAADPPDIVHSHFWMSGLASLQAAARLEVPVVHTFHALGVVKRRHQGDMDTSPPGRLEIEKAVIEGAKRIIATCSDEVFELLRLGADRRRISVVPCGVDTGRFRPDGPSEPRTGSRVICAGRIVARKGVDDAVRAIAEIPEVQLIIAGGPPRDRLEDDPEARRLTELIAALGVGERVDMRGGIGREDVAALMRSADAAVCAPWYEPFGIVPLEAMACGVPVVASTVGGLIDTVVDGETGIHIPPRRPDRIASALRMLLSDASLRRRLGQAGVRRARSRYTWDHVAEGTLAAYERALRARRGGTGVGGRRITADSGRRLAPVEGRS